MNKNKLMKFFNDTDARTVMEQDIADQVNKLAMWIDDALEESAEKTVGLRKLLEARDAFYRGAVEEVTK